MNQSADTADADADTDEDVDVVLDSLCFSCPPTIIIEKRKLNLIVSVLFLKKKVELCSLSLVDTAISDQCANGLPRFEMITCHFPAATSDVQRNLICISFGFLGDLFKHPVFF
jgi:hypothetical protein